MAKPRKQKLKVFKTPMGFHDAYVAAPSRKAALKAWGAGTDLFSAGIAELAAVEDEAAKAALAKPGDVVRVRRTRGKEEPSPSRRKAAGLSLSRKRERVKPKPSRAALDKAEAALTSLEKAQSAERVELQKAEDALAKRRRAVEAMHARARDKAEAKREAAEDRYRRAMRDREG